MNNRKNSKTILKLNKKNWYKNQKVLVKYLLKNI